MANKWFAVEDYGNITSPVRRLSDATFRVWVGIHQYVAEYEEPLPGDEELAARCLGLDLKKVKAALKELREAKLLVTGVIGGQAGLATDFIAEDATKKLKKRLTRSEAARSDHERKRKLRQRLIEGYPIELNEVQQKTIVQKAPAPIAPIRELSSNNNTDGGANALQMLSNRTAHYTLNTVDGTPNTENGAPETANGTPNTENGGRDALAKKYEAPSYSPSPEALGWVSRFIEAYPPNPHGEPWPETTAVWLGVCQNLGSELRENVLKTWASLYQDQWVNVPDRIECRDGANAHRWDFKQSIRERFPRVDDGAPMPPTSWLRLVLMGDCKAVEWPKAFLRPEKARWLYWAILARAQHGDLPRSNDDFDQKMRAELRGLY